MGISDYDKQKAVEEVAALGEQLSDIAKRICKEDNAFGTHIELSVTFTFNRPNVEMRIGTTGSDSLDQVKKSMGQAIKQAKAIFGIPDEELDEVLKTMGIDPAEVRKDEKESSPIGSVDIEATVKEFMEKAAARRKEAEGN